MTSILGGPEIFLDKGSLLNISCIVQGTTAQPKYFFWKHNGNVSHNLTIQSYWISYFSK